MAQNFMENLESNSNDPNDIAPTLCNRNDEIVKVADAFCQLECEEEDGDVAVWADLIPEEIILMVFAKGVRLYGPVPYLCRTAQVCRRWYELSYHPSLWSVVDLSIGWIHRDLAGLHVLCETRLHRTVSLDLTAWFSMDNHCLKCIVEHCTKLDTLRLAHCEKLTPDGVLHVIRNNMALSLRELDLSFVSPLVSSHKCLCRLIRGLASTLRVLTLSSIHVDDHFSTVLADITTHCRGLTHLDLSRLNDTLMTRSTVMVDIEALQHGCPDLHVLLMADSYFKARTASEQAKVFSPGFPMLRKFSAPHKVNEDLLQRILKSSFDLEILRVKLEGRETEELYCSRLPVTSLRKLTIQKAMTQHIHIKWHHSLVYLDLSWLSRTDREQTIDAMMRRLFDVMGPVFSALRTILLCGCQLSANGVRPMIDCCPVLDHLNLNFCAMLPYGWSREYRGVQFSVFKHVMLGLPNYTPGS